CARRRRRAFRSGTAESRGRAFGGLSSACSSEAEFLVDVGHIAFPLAMKAREKAVGGCHARCDHIAQRVEEAAFIVARAVELLAAGYPFPGDVEDPGGELLHGFAIGSNLFELELRV